MSGIICCARLILAISVLQFALLQWRSDLNKIQEKNESQRNQWKSVAGEGRPGRPGKGTDLFEASDHYYHEQFMESFSSTDYSKLDYDRAWSSQEWKAEAGTTSST